MERGINLLIIYCYFGNIDETKTYNSENGARIRNICQRIKIYFENGYLMAIEILWYNEQYQPFN